MKRIIAGVAVITALALAGCGGSGSSSTTTSATTQAAPAQTPQQAHTGYYNMTTLQTEIQTELTKRLSDSGATVTVNSVTCFLSGAQTANCSIVGSDGSGTNVVATISPDGLHFSTPGSYTPSGPSTSSTPSQ